MNKYEKAIQNVVNFYNDGEDIKLVEDDGDVKELALEWYKGEVDNVHKYYVFNGKKKVHKTRKTMGLVKQTSETIANLLLNEKCDVVLGDDNDKVLMDSILQRIHFWQSANRTEELAFALGYSAWVEGVGGLKQNEDGLIINDHTGKCICEYIDNSKIKPLIIEDGMITDCAFFKVNTLDTIISIHCLDRRKDSPTKGNYVITNLKIANDGEETIKEKVTINTLSTIKWFQITQPNIINNANIGSPIGLPFWWNAQDSLDCIDCTYDSLDNEIRNGRRRIFLNEDLLARYVDVDGNQVEPFDPYDSEYYYIPKMDGDNKQMINDSAPQLRINELVSALNMQLNVFTSKVGFGENFYNYEAGKRVMTATQVISENGQLFRTIKKHEILLEEALIEFFKAIIYITNNFTSDKFSEQAMESIAIKFDDSIIEDKPSEQKIDASNVQTGIMTNVEYRMKWFAEDEITATQKVGYLDLANMYNSLAGAITSGQMSPEQFVELVKQKFPKMSMDGIVEYIKEKQTSNMNIDNPANMFEPEL